MSEMIKLYVNNCPGCDHWREYDLIGVIGKNLYFRCPECNTAKIISYDELEKIGQWEASK